MAGSIGPTGELFQPLGALTHSIATVAFCEQASALAKGGADVLWIETMSSNKEVSAAIEAAKTIGLPICSTMTFGTARRSKMGVTPADLTGFVAAQGADFIGVNYSIGPAKMLHSLQGILTQANDTPIVAKGNCGIPTSIGGVIHYLGKSELMAE